MANIVLYCVYTFNLYQAGMLFLFNDVSYISFIVILVRQEKHTPVAFLRHIVPVAKVMGLVSKLHEETGYAIIVYIKEMVHCNRICHINPNIKHIMRDLL